MRSDSLCTKTFIDTLGKLWRKPSVERLLFPNKSKGDGHQRVRMSDSNAIYDCVSHLFMCRSTLIVLIVGGITVIVIIYSVAESDSTNNQQSSPPTKVKPHDSTSNYRSTD